MLRKRWLLYLLLLSIILVNVEVEITEVHAQEKEVVGWIEETRLYPVNITIDAKLDTGAQTSSLNAPYVRIFEKNGKKWASFEIMNHQGEKAEITGRIVRTARIKRKGQVSQNRPVIKLGICLSTVYREVEVNLIDRSNYDYQLLVGRNLLAGGFIIDPEIQYVTKPNCKNIPK